MTQPETPRLDAPLADAPATDLPPADVPLADVPLADVPLADVPLAASTAPSTAADVAAPAPTTPESPVHGGTDHRTNREAPEPTVARRVHAPSDLAAPAGSTDPESPGRLRLNWSALSDVGRVRKDNQDSGYAGPHLLVVCDGVGGAARGDIASATAVQALRRLDEPASGDSVARVAGALQRAHDRIGDLTEADESLSGTSTTATVALFDGRSVTIGHVGDSRAYLLRGGELSQLTHDHTFVQSLVDEGRITPDEARVHPHRNLILKAVDGVRDPEPDLFSLEVAAGDRLLLCSDGACGVLDDPTLAVLLAEGTPDFAAVELVRASLEAGSTDNVTCVVADVVAPDTDLPDELAPLLVGAAADLPRTVGAGTDETSGRIQAVAATEATTGEDGRTVTDGHLDEETVRYAPQPPRRFTWLKQIFVLITLAGITWVALVAAWTWSQKQYYVGEHDGAVTIYRGIDASLPGIDLSHPYETSNVELSQLSDYDAELVREGITANNLANARETVDNLATKRVGG